MNVANALTLARIGLVPPLVLLLASGADAEVAGGVFAVAALTDALDGYLARSRNMVTTFGVLMDPIADKLLIGGAFVSLAAVGRLEAWIVAVILLREVAVSGLRWRAKREGVLISANAWGKAKTALQTVTILALIGAPGADAAWIELLLAATIAITIVSGITYAAAYFASGPAAERPVTP